MLPDSLDDPTGPKWTSMMAPIPEIGTHKLV